MRLKTNKAYLIRAGIGLALSAIFISYVLGIVRYPFFQSLENMAYDIRLNLTRPDAVDRRIVIVDIDEKSLKEEGRWPWGRDRLALLIEQLFKQYNVSIVGFDVLFAEPDNSSGLDILESMSKDSLRNNTDFQNEFHRIRPSLERDKLFARTMSKYPIVLGYYFKNQNSHGDSTSTSGLLPKAIFTQHEKFKGIPFVKATGYGGPLPQLMLNASGAGFIDMSLIDTDGIIRKIPFVQSYQGRLYESLSLAILRSLLGNPPVELKVLPGYENSDVNLGLEYISTGGFDIPVDETGTALVPFRGKFPSFPYVSAIDVINGAAPEETLQNAIILVGTTAAGLLDLRATPMQNFYPGVEVHANIIAGVLDGDVKHRPGYVNGIEFIVIFTSGLLMSLIFPFLRISVTLIITLALLVFIVGANFYAWTALKIDLPIVAELLMILLLYAYYLSYEFFIENRKKRHITRLFGQYVPPELVEEMSRNPTDYAMDGGTREMSVMFTDIRNFTAMSEKLDPKQLTQLVNQYFTEMTKIIHSHRGTIDKYIGDSIMAFWGAPLVEPDHAKNALKAALEMIKAQPIIDERFRINDWPLLKMGIGINSGPMHVGNMGSEFRMSYTVLGDEVNLASRLESLTKRYSVPIIVSESTKKALPNLAYRELDLVRVVGKNKPVRIFEPLMTEDELTNDIKEELALYHEALNCYRERKWARAKKLFMDLIELTGGPLLYQEYLGRTLRLIHKPPADNWDGVYTLKSK